MARFTFIGEQGGTVAFGRPFPFGEPVEVSDDDPCIGKMRSNAHFAESFDGVEVLDAEVAPQKRRGRPPKDR